mgnify:CR=1 FL=1
MKRRSSSTWILVGLWFVALSIVLGTWWIIAAQTKVAHELAQRIEGIEAEVLNGDWENASQLIRELMIRWEKTRQVWAFHTEHAEMDEVTDALIEAEALIAANEAGALAPLRKARDRIVTLPQRDRLDWENLF